FLTLSLNGKGSNQYNERIKFRRDLCRSLSVLRSPGKQEGYTAGFGTQTVVSTHRMSAVSICIRRNESVKKIRLLFITVLVFALLSGPFAGSAYGASDRYATVEEVAGTVTVRKAG